MQTGPAAHRGFTLVEAMVALAILSILMAVGAPAMHTFIQNQQIRSSAEELQSGITLARNEALRRNARVTLWMVDQLSASCALSSSGNAWVVSQDNPAGACGATASESNAPRLIQSRGPRESGRGTILAATDSTSVATNCITFNGFGMAEAACTGGGAPLAQVNLSQTGARALRLKISPGGAARVCDPSITDNTNPAICP
jgi:type IV fimbrial biogenesis protein FimT